jgi:hypothetical protein
MTETRTLAPSVLAWGLVGLTASLVVFGLVVPTFSPAPGATEPTLSDIGYGPRQPRVRSRRSPDRHAASTKLNRLAALFGGHRNKPSRLG